MNRLTDRLQMIADEIKKGETMADIGTDHGFLPLYLWENGICPSVIMCDISEASLAKAKGAAGAYQFGNELDFRTGDGLRVLREAEVDDVVIAGMGGLLIRDILADDMIKTLSFRKYVLQPRNNSGKLRFWLEKHGLAVTRNQLVREGRFICEVVTAEPRKIPERANYGISDGIYEEGSAYWELPYELTESQPALTGEFAEVKLAIEKKILDGITKAKDAGRGEADRVVKRMEYFQNVRDKCR